MLLVYIAGPYRAADISSKAANIQRARILGQEVCCLGLNAYPVIPHKNTEHFDELREEAYWLEGTLQLMRRCDCVLLVDGWEKSQGTLGEIREAEAMAMPVFDNIDDLADYLRQRGA